MNDAGKRIKLETLGKIAAYTVLFLNYGGLIFAIVFNQFEFQLRVEQTAFPAIQVDDYAFELIVGGFSPASRFILSDVAADNCPHELSFLANVYALNASADYVPVLLNSSALMELDHVQCDIGVVDNNSGDDNVPSFAQSWWSSDKFWSGPHKRRRSGASNAVQVAPSAIDDVRNCRAGPVLWTNVIKPVPNAPRLQLRNVRFTINNHSESFTLVEMSVVLALCVITLVSFAYWIMLYCRTRRRLVPEQRWIAYILLCLFFGQRPLFVLTVLTPYSLVTATITTVLHEACYTATLIYFLLLLDALSYKSTTLPVRFYVAKILFGAVWLACAVSWSVFDQQDAQLTQSQPLYALLVLLLALLTGIGLLVWVVWVCHLFLRTRSRLARLPYLSNRWRQLSFRFMSAISTTFFLYMLASLIITVVRNSNIDLNDSATTDRVRIESSYFWMSTLALISIYVYTIAYVFLPPRASCHCPSPDLALESLLLGSQLLPEPTFGIRRHRTRRFASKSRLGLFCLEEAALCLELSWQVYFDLPGRASASGFGELDAARLQQRWSLQVADFVVEESSDTHVLVTRRTHTVYVCVRGTASFENALTDLRMTTVELPYPESEPSVFPPPRVHKGFFEAFTRVWPPLLAALRTAAAAAAADSAQRRVDLVFTGHSLGGALASLGALFARWALPACRVCVYSFGAPRIGTYTFAKMFERNVHDCFRVCCDRDLVTTMPKLGFLYKHVGREVAIDRRGNCVVNMSYIERFFRPRRSSLKDHRLDEYRAALMAALRRHEQHKLSRRLQLDDDEKARLIDSGVIDRLSDSDVDTDLSETDDNDPDVLLAFDVIDNSSSGSDSAADAANDDDGEKLFASNADDNGSDDTPPPLSKRGVILRI